MSMTMTTLSGLAIAVVAATTAASGTASAAASPGFLRPADLPPHPTSPWTAGKVTTGLPDALPFCVGDDLPGGNSTRHRAFRTELDTNALQVTTERRTAAAARDLATRLNRSLRQCATETEQQYPDVTAEWRDFGTLPVEEGAHVYGVHTETTWGATDIHLFAVGRDGDTVTVVHWGQMGDFADAPVASFEDTATTAVNRLR
ncbi:hypothetical protein [Streptomyces sp. 6N223]|uniref:hypothetical protein n=1 Tax=Streptomyces sp. 6N223 TaxID=3457412 RepID=UPI003FD17823